MAKQQIKTWVANTWVKLLQTTGQSTNKAMSQKAVSDEFNQLKSDLYNKANLSDLGLKAELIYQNLTSDVAFDGRTFNLNKDYSAILVYYRINTSFGIGNTITIIKGTELGAYEFYEGAKILYRFFHYNKGENIFKIGNCTELNSSTISNNFIIPLIIYGII